MKPLQKIGFAIVAWFWFGGPAHGTVFSPTYQFQLPAGHAYAVGMAAKNEKLFLFTTETYYVAPLDVGGSMSFSKSVVNFFDLGIRTSPDTLIAFNPASDDGVLITGGLGFSVFLYNFGLTPPGQTNVPLSSLSYDPSGLAVTQDGAVFLSSRHEGGGVLKLSNADDNTVELTLGTSGPGALSEPKALSLGPDGLVYVLDTGDERIVVFNTEGEYQSAFNLVNEAMESALAIDDDGRLYTMNSLGGGDIYNIYTGAHIGMLENTNDVGIGPGKASLLYNGGYLFATTGHGANIHVYTVPEPGAVALFSLALAGMTGLARSRRRSTVLSRR